MKAPLTWQRGCAAWEYFVSSSSWPIRISPAAIWSVCCRSGRRTGSRSTSYTPRPGTPAFGYGPSSTGWRGFALRPSEDGGQHRPRAVPDDLHPNAEQYEGRQSRQYRGSGAAQFSQDSIRIAIADVDADGDDENADDVGHCGSEQRSELPWGIGAQGDRHVYGSGADVQGQSQRIKGPLAEHLRVGGRGPIRD